METTVNRSRFYLRLLIYAQVAWIVVVGAIVRGVVNVPEPWRSVLTADVEMLIEFVAIIAPLILLPGLVTFLLYQASLPPKRTILLGLVQGGLTVAAFAALLPAIQ